MTRRRVPSPRTLTELTALALVFVVSSVVGHRFLVASQTKTIVEWELAPAVMVACGAGFTRPEVETPTLQEFLLRQRESVTCAEVEGQPGVLPLPVARGERSAIYAAGMALRVGGLSWRTLDAYFSLVFGFTMVMAYGIFRLAVGPGLAVAGVVGLVWSTQVLALLSFRDFGKAPAFFALWLVLGWLIRRGIARAGSKVLVPAAGGGALLGIGLGFRVDVIVFIPVFVAVLAVVIPGFDRRALRTKAIALGLFALSFLSTGWPVLGSMSEGSNSSHVVVLGLMTSFTRELGLEPPAYDIGDTYSDPFAYTLVAAHADLVQHEKEAIVFGSAKYDAAGGQLLVDMARHFPADVLVRALSATAQVIASPFGAVARGGYLQIAPMNSSPAFLTIGRWRDLVLKPVEGRALWLAALVLLVLSLRGWRLGVLSAMLVLYFCGYSMLQFSRRHTFHLDLVGIGIFLFAVRLVMEQAWRSGLSWWRGATTAGPRSHTWPGTAVGVVVVGVLGVTLYATLLGARWWQQSHVRGMIEQTLAVVWDDSHVVPEPLSQSMMVDGRPRPTWQAIHAANPDRWNSGVLFRVPRATSADGGSLSRNGMQTEYLRVDLDARCASPVVSIVVAYTGSESTLYREYTRLFDVPVEPGVEGSRLLVPVFYHDGAAWTNFDGVAAPSGQASCVIGIHRASAPGAVPFPLMTAVLGPRWHDTRWYQRRP